MNCVEIPLKISFKLIKIDNIIVFQLLEKFVFLWKSRHSAQNLICYSTVREVQLLSERGDARAKQRSLEGEGTPADDEGGGRWGSCRVGRVGGRIPRKSISRQPHMAED